MTDTNSSSTNLGEKHLVVIYAVSGTMALVVVAVGIYLIMHFCCHRGRCANANRRGRSAENRERQPRRRRRHRTDRLPPEVTPLRSLTERPRTRTNQSANGRNFSTENVELWLHGDTFVEASGRDTSMALATLDHSIHNYCHVDERAIRDRRPLPKLTREPCIPPPKPSDQSLLPEVAVLETREQLRQRQLDETKRIFPDAELEQVYLLRGIFVPKNVEPPRPVVPVGSGGPVTQNWLLPATATAASPLPRSPDRYGRNDIESPPGYPPPPPPPPHTSSGRIPPDQQPLQSEPASLTGTVDVDGCGSTSTSSTEPLSTVPKELAKPPLPADGKAQWRYDGRTFGGRTHVLVTAVAAADEPSVNITAAVPTATNLRPGDAAAPPKQSNGSQDQTMSRRLLPCSPTDSPATALKITTVVDPVAAGDGLWPEGVLQQGCPNQHQQQQLLPSPDSSEGYCKLPVETSAELNIDGYLQQSLSAHDCYTPPGHSGRGGLKLTTTLAAEHLSRLQQTQFSLHGPSSLMDT